MIALFGGNIGLFSVLPIEDQLKAEWNTIWADITDGTGIDFTKIGTIGFGTGTYKKVSGTTITTYSNDGNYILFDNTATLILDDKNYKGQKMIFYLRGSGGKDESTNVQIAGNCNIHGVYMDCDRSGERATICPSMTVELEPRRNTSQVYIKKNGLTIADIEVGDTFHPQISCSQTVGHWFYGFLDFVGYKAEYECDLTIDEVWVEETFTSDFTIEDLTFDATKLCQATRPMIERDLVLGEKELSSEDGIDLLNTGQTITATADKVIIVNYATYYVEGLLNPCEPNEANVWDGSQWVCESIIEPITIIQQCAVATDCPNPCVGQSVECTNNNCVYTGNCLAPPQDEQSVWDMISNIFAQFWNFVKSIFGV